MEHNNDENLTGENSSSNKKENWLNEHGQPDFEYLQSLSMDASPGSLEKLKSIAEDLNVGYDSNTPAELLVRKIISQVNERGNSSPTT